MREDTERQIASLSNKSMRKDLQKKYLPLVEELESRLSAERTVEVVLACIIDTPESSDLGVLLITDYGIHCKGESRGAARVDLPWLRIDQADISDVTGKRSDLVIESTNKDHRFRFRLFEDDVKLAVRNAVSRNQTLL